MSPIRASAFNDKPCFLYFCAKFLAMAFDNRDSIDFGKSDIPKLFRSIFIPTLFGMLFNVAFILTDGIFVGHGVGPEGIAVVNLIAPILMLVTGLGMLFGIGSSVVAAIHLSQENPKAARINVTLAFMAGITIAALLGLVLYLFPNGIMRLLGVSHDLMPMARTYYLWFIPTCLLVMSQTIGEFVIRLDGSPRYAMFANIIPAVINIILDYVFIFPCGWGLMGAALATDIGAGVGMLMTFYYMIFRPKQLSFYRLKRTWTSLRLSLRNVGYMFKLGLSAFIGEFAISIMMVTGNNVFGKYLGDNGIAAFSVICYLSPVVTMVYNAVAQSAQPIISFNHGARQGERVRRTFSHSLSISLFFGVLVTLIFCLFAPQIIAIFLESNTEPFTLASHGLPLYAIGYVFVAYNFSVIGYFQSIEQANFATLLMLLRGCIFLIPAFLLMPMFFGVKGMWLAVPIAELLTFIVGFISRKMKMVPGMVDE